MALLWGKALEFLVLYLLKFCGDSFHKIELRYRAQIEQKK